MTDARTRAAELLDAAQRRVRTPPGTPLEQALRTLDDVRRAAASSPSPTAFGGRDATARRPQLAPLTPSGHGPARPVAASVDGQVRASPAGASSPADKRPVFLLAVTTWNRREYLDRFVQSFLATRSRRFSWVLVVADDGSVDGTLEHLESLDLPDCRLVVVRNKGATITGQTNSIFLVAQSVGFDFAMKCDDDVYFSAPGWDELYFDTATETGVQHLVHHNASWKPRVHDVAKGRLRSSVPALEALGCAWTFTPAVLHDVGWFDEDNFRFRGHAHLDFTVRACRAGHNDERTLWDAAGSEDVLAMWGRDAYVQTVDWQDAKVKALLNPQERARRMAVIADVERRYVPLTDVLPSRRRARVSVRPSLPEVREALARSPRFDLTDGPARGVDAVFVLNLEADVRKWADAAAALARHGVRAERFPAVNGNHPEHVAAWRRYADEGLVLPIEKQIGRRLIASPGAWGYLLTMRALLKQAVERRLHRIMIFDDDVLLHHGFGDLLSEVQYELPPQWRIVYLGCTQKDWSRTQEYSQHLYRPGVAVNGSFAYLLDASTFPDLLERIDRFDWPFDSGPLTSVAQAAPEQTFVARPHLAVADVSTSDIRAPRDLTAFAAEARWDLELYSRPEPRPAHLTGTDRRLPTERLVSVLLVAEDHEATVADALDSLRGQTWGRLEILTLSNASTDRTLDVLRDRAVLDSRVHVLSVDTRLTGAAALSLLVARARGQWLMVHAADEVSTSDRIMSLLHAADADPSADVVPGTVLTTPCPLPSGAGADADLVAWAAAHPDAQERQLLSAGLLGKGLMVEAGALESHGEDGVIELLQRVDAARRSRRSAAVRRVVPPAGVLAVRPDSHLKTRPDGGHGRDHDEVARGLRPAFRAPAVSAVRLTEHLGLDPSDARAPHGPAA